MIGKLNEVPTIKDRIGELLASKWGGNQSAMGRDIGISQPLLSMVLKGGRKPGRRLMSQLIRFGVSEDWLLHGKGEPCGPAEPFVPPIKDRIGELLASKWAGNQARMARDLDVSTASLSLVLNGKTKPGRRVLSQIVRNGGVSEDWLLHGKGKPFDQAVGLQKLSPKAAAFRDYLKEVIPEQDYSECACCLYLDTGATVSMTILEHTDFVLKGIPVTETGNIQPGPNLINQVVAVSYEHIVAVTAESFGDYFE